jgi:hypothetical protein
MPRAILTKETAVDVEHQPERDDTPPAPLAGHAVLDSELRSVGTVTDVLYDEREIAPLWAVVKTGAFFAEHYVPLVDSYLDRDGRLVVPHDKASIKRAPRAHRDHVLTHRDARELHDYYNIAA